MALTTKQRNALPSGAFLDPKNRRFPAPTKVQARKAHISEAQRARTLRNALSRAGQDQARGVRMVTPAAVNRTVKSRGAGAVHSVVERRGRPARGASRPGRVPAAHGRASTRRATVAAGGSRARATQRAGYRGVSF
jgi:hypothetical protein